MRALFVPAFLAGFALVLPAACAADALTVADAYIRAPQPGSQVAAAYLRITNKGPEADTLVGVKTTLGTASVHEMATEGGIMRMRALPAGLDVPAGADVVLKPGGNHLMIEKLATAPKPGEQVTLVLSFKRAGDLSVPFEVRPLGK